MANIRKEVNKLKIEEKPKVNSRQIPKTVKYCTDKRYNDIVYAYLQCISEFDEENKIRYFYKN